MKKLIPLVFFLILALLLARTVGATVVVPETLYPVGNVTDEWTGDTTHWDQIDETGCVNSDSLYTSSTYKH